MEVDAETIEAIKIELGLLRLAIKTSPEYPVGRIHDCGCMGPMPECRCMKQQRLITEFLKDE